LAHCSAVRPVGAVYDRPRSQKLFPPGAVIDRPYSNNIERLTIYILQEFTCLNLP